ncbi:hybrid sensor histidine kinase/response regulator [Leptolyngbya sp. 7M]|uniref:hybrid sensor histidine kinase/response regulator n=1 Tax=Leptolyngbya sp. 7M TaxID=2812896 RepID=UPI001B8C3FF2|nr:hybrid sensor histidine kinase/response regulator [Leptolyngbya sp. 7M]QYO63301.1 hybrid sensor histidine kinase/response regulator [Leptolyngbya sp. 7M]
MSSVPTSHTDSPGVRGTILIVDDTPNNLRLLSSMLTKQGYEVRSAISGSVALMAVRTVPLDLILLDINMPKMNGYEVCQQLKADEQTRDIPVIFLSALGEPLDKVQAFQVGGVDYITKPFQVEEVLARVENHLMLRRMQIELQQAKADALRALAQEQELNRLKSEFVAMISHDFRTPLTSIQGFAELLHYGGDTLTVEMQERYFDKINAAVEHMLYLLDEVLMIGRIESGTTQCQPVLLDLEKFCREIYESLELSAHHRYKIQFSYTGDCKQVSIDQVLLNRILTNLLSNAIKYSPEYSQIDFNVHCDTRNAVFEIKDEGIGIPLENQQQLFKTFYRCSNVGQIKGTGLGLAVVKRCVDAHQGQIQLESQEGVGTTVRVQLPIEMNNAVYELQNVT